MFNIDFRNHIIYNENDLFTKRVRLFTGYSCNYKCGFCFYKGQKSKSFDKEIKRQACIAKINNIDNLDLSGGEPTILKNWFDMISILKNLGFKNLAVITNGSTFDNSSFLKDSINCGINEVLFSYHGPSAEIHDSMTDHPGSYKKLWNSMTNVVDSGITIRVNTVVTKNNYKYLPMIAKDMIDINPNCFNFLPFRLENQSTPDNMVTYKESIKYIKEAIDIMSSNNIFISVRYLPFCVMQGYEKYVSGWLQKLYDPYEWSQHVFDCLENIRLDTKMNKECFTSNKSKKDLEFAATYDAIKSTSGYVTSCIKCNHKWICEGIWRTYNKVFGSDEFIPIVGEDIVDIMYYRRLYVQSCFDNTI
jgi:sulfatase maturation enzyme AslB (radical SAM superfamily)